MEPNTKNPLVSIIVNCYNGEEYLHEALTSISNQTYNNWEVIFWDNGSNDKTKIIATTFSKKIKYFYSEVNEPLGVARNKALERCKGKYITFLDSDDIYLSNSLMKLVSSIETEKVALSYGGVEYIDSFGNTIDSVKPKDKSGDLFGQLLNQFDIHVPSVIIDNEVIKQNNYYINNKLECSEEYNLFMKIALNHKISSISKVISKYRILSDSLSVKTYKRHGLERRITLNELIELKPVIQYKFKQELKEAFARSEYYDSRYFLLRNRKKEGIKTLSKVMFVNYKYFSLFLLALLPKIIWSKIHKIKNKRFIN